MATFLVHGSVRGRRQTLHPLRCRKLFHLPGPSFRSVAWSPTDPRLQVRLLRGLVQLPSLYGAEVLWKRTTTVNRHSAILSTSKRLSTRCVATYRCMGTLRRQPRDLITPCNFSVVD